MAQFTLEQIARIRNHARQLVSNAIIHEGRASRALASVEAGLERPDVDAARQLCLGAREQRIAAERLVMDLGSPKFQPSGEQTLGLAVLVVEDYEATREWLAVLLENAGFTVRTAANGLEAVIAAYELQPEVILMDLTMPVLDGIEAARLIREIEHLRATRLIAYTANAYKAPEVSSPFAAILRKPSPPDIVVETVKRWAVPAA